MGNHDEMESNKRITCPSHTFKAEEDRDPSAKYQTPEWWILAWDSNHAPFQESHRNILQLIIILRF